MKTILIIEDEPQIRRNIATLLELEGYRILEATNGIQGIEVARQGAPDLILCDITMPDMDGFAVIHVIRSIPALNAVPFIFLTAHSHPSEVRAGMNLGADDYLSKPFTAPHLLGAIESRMHRVKCLLHAAQASQPHFESTEPLEELGLTPSEAKVLLWMAQAKSNADIAAILECTVGTVKKHAQRIFDKLGVDNRTAAMIVAREALVGRGVSP